MDWLKRFFGRSSQQQRADELMKRGLACVRDGRAWEALAIASELHSLRYSGGFEVEAQALAQDGSKEEAVAVLRKGLQAAPHSWLNGNLLGNYLSDLGRYEEAFAAYEETLRAPTADRVLIEANYANALQRAGRDDEARAKLQVIMGNDLSDAEPGLQDFVQSLADNLRV
jgi:tetratricopeptide (TPR) repeat protein